MNGEREKERKIENIKLLAVCLVEMPETVSEDKSVELCLENAFYIINDIIKKSVLLFSLVFFSSHF